MRGRYAMHYDFAPDGPRARQLDRSMLVRLGESLRHLSDRCRGIVEHDVAKVGALAEALCRGERQTPTIFAYYYKLLQALLDEAFDSAERYFAALAESEPLRGAAPRIAPLTRDALGSSYWLYRDLMNCDPTLEVGFASPSDTTFSAFRQRLESGLRLMRAAVPQLCAEIEAIVHDIVIVAGDKSKKLQFDGGSHFQLWGALFLNGDSHHDDVAIVEVLAHESAHSLLFGLCTEEFLVENDDDELYASPLRSDPRPMDGIYHATFVSARMHWTLDQLLASGILDAPDRERALKANALNVSNFNRGLAVVEEHGRLTSLGEQLMQGASAYMAGVS